MKLNTIFVRTLRDLALFATLVFCSYKHPRHLLYGGMDILYYSLINNLFMVDLMLISTVGGYSQNEWTNPRTGERKIIKSFGLVLQQGNNSYVAEANDEVAERLKNMNLQPDTRVIASLSFSAQRNEKDGAVRYFQRVRIENIVVV